MVALRYLGALAAGWVILPFVLIVGVYVIQGLAFMRIFKMCGHPNAWAGFVPIYNFIVMYQCIDADYADLIGNISIPYNVFKWWWIISAGLGLLMLIPYVGPIAFAAFCVFAVLAMGWTFRMLFAVARGTDPEDEIMNGWLCVTNPLLAVLFMLTVEPVEDER